MTSLEPSSSAAAMSVLGECPFDERDLDAAVPIVVHASKNERMRQKLHRMLSGLAATIASALSALAAQGDLRFSLVIFLGAGAFTWLTSWPLFALMGALLRARFTSSCNVAGLRQDILLDAVRRLTKNERTATEDALRESAGGRSLRG